MSPVASQYRSAGGSFPINGVITPVNPVNASLTRCRVTFLGPRRRGRSLLPSGLSTVLISLGLGRTAAVWTVALVPAADS
jgi:hypothetical protein